MTSDHEQFEEDMQDAGFDAEPYNGRFYWSGPAVRVNDLHGLQEVIRATTVHLQWDSLGKSGFIVYPYAQRAAPREKEVPA